MREEFLAGAGDEVSAKSTSSAPSPKAVGKVVRRLRKAMKSEDDGGVTQAALAEKVGYKSASGHVSISNIERGRALPSPDFRDALAEKLGTTWSAIEAEAQLIDTAAEGDGDDGSGSLTTIKQIIVGKQKVRNEAKTSKLERDLADLRERHRMHVERLEGSIARSRNEFTDPFFLLLSGISGLDEANLDPAATGLAPDAGSDVAEALALNRTRVSRSIVDMVGTTAAVGALGAGLGAAAAFTTYSAVGAFATASTGTAIASLAGASATSATFAWLGGGSLAAGGAGVAGGTAVLSGILTVPAILAVLTVLVWKGRKIRKQSDEDARTIAEAEQELADIESSLTQAWAWADDIAQIHDEATLEGVSRLSRLTHVVIDLGDAQASTQSSDESSTEPVSFREIDGKAPGITQECLQIATVLLTLQALPIWSRIAELDSQVNPHGGQEGTDIPGTTTAVTQESSQGQQQPLRWEDWNASAESWNSASIQAAQSDMRALAEERRRQVPR